MASQQSIVDELVFNLSGAGEVTARKMFGDYGVFLEGRMIALICDDRLLFKPTAEGRKLLRPVIEEAPYAGAKPCFLVPESEWNKRAWLAKLAAVTAAGLPLPKKKGQRKKMPNRADCAHRGRAVSSRRPEQDGRHRAKQ